MADLDGAVILRVTLTRDYVVPMYDAEHSQINGWTIDEVKRDWFSRYPLVQSHATRDGHRVGNSERLVSITVVESINDD